MVNEPADSQETEGAVELGRVSPRTLAIAGTIGIVVLAGGLYAASGITVEFGFVWKLALVVFGFIALSFRYRKLGDMHLVATLEGCAMLMVFSSTYMVTTYLLPEHAPFGFWDEQFARFDAALGLTADDIVMWSRSIPWFDELLAKIYYWFFYQYALFLIYAAGIRRDPWRAYSVLSEMFVCAFIGLGLFAVFPSLNAVWYYGHEDIYYTRTLVEHLIQLRDGTFETFRMGEAQGLIQFPSFHVAIALILGWDLRREPKWAFALAIVWTSLMTLSAVTTGGHYVVDLFGGLLIAASGIVLVKWFGKGREEFDEEFNRTD